MPTAPCSAVRAAGHISKRARALYKALFDAGRLVVDGSLDSEDRAAAADLEGYGFVFRQPTPTGYDLHPTPFEVLVPSLIHRIEWQYPPFVEITKEQREKLRTDLTQLLVGGQTRTGNAFTQARVSRTLEGSPDIDAFVASLLPDAEQVDALSAAEWSSNLPLVWAVLSKRLDQGLLYRRIVSPVGLLAFGWRINDRDMRIGVNLRVSVKPTLSPFYVFRGPQLLSALVFVPPGPGTHDALATYTDLAQLTERLTVVFNDLWEDGVPARVILDRLTEDRPEYLARASNAFGPQGERLGASLLDEGIFGVLTDSDRELLTDFVDSELATRTEYSLGLHNYIPDLTAQIIKYCANKGRADG